MSVSIHAPVRGATAGRASAASSHRFNPRARTGRDASALSVACMRDDDVSIHAPVRGATIAIAYRAICEQWRFNPRARTGRDVAAAALRMRQRVFQSTRPYGARRRCRACHSVPSHVSIHAPVRGATSRRACCTAVEFQSTRPYGARRHRMPIAATRCFNPRARTGRDCSGASASRLHRSFNPRARTGRDLRELDLHATLRVSIHAPVRGATQHVRSNSDVSIHAPVRGATSIVVADVNRFNPRARTGRDTSAGTHASRIDVSIHAPVRGATLSRSALRALYRCFNPRARTGRDSQCAEFAEHVPYGFNPRARTGRDRARRSHVPLHRCVSIHAPVRGATRSVAACSRTRDWFQSTRPYGARRRAR